MFFWRALLGVGEASYGVIAPALLADLFAVEKRGRAMGIYYLALPIGRALGFIIAGRVALDWGWPPVFFVVGLPGLLAAVAGLLILDPGRGASEGRKYAGKADRPRFRDYAELFKTPTFVFNTAGMAAVTFATGAYAAWGSTFYQPVRGMSLKEAKDSIGVLLAVAGLVGIAAVHVPRRLSAQVHAAGLSASCQRGRARVGSRWVSRHSRSRRVRRRWACCSGHRCCWRWCSARRTRSPPTSCRPIAAPRAMPCSSS